jgi:hypothetical protein
VSPRYVIADGLGIAAWIEGDYWTADWSAARKFYFYELAVIAARKAGLQDYTIHPLPAEQAQAS